MSIETVGPVFLLDGPFSFGGCNLLVLKIRKTGIEIAIEKVAAGGWPGFEKMHNYLTMNELRAISPSIVRKK